MSTIYKIILSADVFTTKQSLGKTFHCAHLLDLGEICCTGGLLSNVPGLQILGSDPDLVLPGSLRAASKGGETFLSSMPLLLSISSEAHLPSSGVPMESSRPERRKRRLLLLSTEGTELLLRLSVETL